MIYFNAETMKFFGKDPEFYMSVGEVLAKYKENFEGGPINQKIKNFEETHERSIATIDADHAPYIFTIDEIEAVLQSLKIVYTRIYG